MEVLNHMVRCNRCGNEFDEIIASGICPHCGGEYVEKRNAVYGDGHIESVSDRSEAIDPRWLPVDTLLNGRYRVQKVIGAGGFGITYKAIDEKTGIYKAVKEYFQSGVVNRIPGTTQVLISAPKRREEFEYGKKRLLNEAQIVAKFQSSGIVRVDDYFEENGTSYMVMEFLDSQTLEDYMITRHRLLSQEEVVNIGVSISEALEEIHRAGVVHRDIAPDNLFINSDGEVKIIDFGSARLSKADTDDRLIVLKPGFAPPEQYEKIDIKNDRQKEWTDVYALGATLYLCLTGIVPPESSDRKADADNGEDRLKEPRQINPNVPEWLNNTILTAMAIDTHERFKDASELKTALLQERKVLSIEKVRKRKKFRRTTGIAVSFVIIALIVAFGVRRYYARREQAILKPASIKVWYMVGNEDADGSKESIMSSIRSEHEESDLFSQVTIEFEGIPEDEYFERLNTATLGGELPNLFEYPGKEGAYSEELVELDDVLLDKTIDCYFLNDYKKAYNSYDRFPTAFNIPVIYINTGIAGDYDSKLVVEKLDDLSSLAYDQAFFEPICIKPKIKADYEEMFTDFKDYQGLSVLESNEFFLENKSVIYLGDSSDFYSIRKALGVSFSMEPVMADKVICRFSGEWCINKIDENTDAAAKTVLRYLLYNNDQEKLYLRDSDGIPLPLDKTSLESFQEYPSIRAGFDELLSDELIAKFEVRSE